MNPHTPRILCVDDESLNIELLEALLSPRGYEVVSAVSGLDAMEMIKTGQIDLCLLDVMMPGMDGFELCRQLKSDEAERNIPVILITSLTDRESRIRGIEAGADDFISKPFDSAEVLARIKMLLNVRRVENEKLLLEQQLEHSRKLESLGVLAGGIAHDFNNLLTIIIGNCYLAKLRPESLEKHIDIIEKASERAALLCRQMLTYAGKAPFDEAQVKMGLLLEEMVKLFNQTITRNITITLDLSADIPTIRSDATQLGQTVMNLLLNASEAIGAEQGEIQVALAQTEIRAEHPDEDHLGNNIPAGRYLCLEVSDSGCGMNEETKRRIFEPFYSTKFAGRGLGMSAVLGIIKAHGGALQLASQPGRGTTVRVYLPVTE